jgi:cell wall-associated NlpC family hydrolase
MAYGRACLLGAFLVGATLPAFQAGAQAPLPAVLRSAQAVGSDDSALLQDNALASPLLAGLALPTSIPAPSSDAADLPRPFAAISASARSLRDSLVTLARAQIGRRYRFGGTSPEHGFDCSGLVRYVMSALHVVLPRTAKEQARTGMVVARDTAQLQPGDLVTFGSSRRISHIGIYVGNGRFVQASSKAGRVIETPLFRRLVPGVKPWRGARRVVPEDATTATDAPKITDRDDDG